MLLARIGLYGAELKKCVIINIMKIASRFELPISKENESVLAIVAMELGYDGAIGTPQEYIEKHFNDFYDNIRIKTETGLVKFYGTSQKDKTDAILAQYDANIIRTVDITND